MSNINPSTRRVAVVDYGITVVSSGEQAPILDVVFVHGLGGHPEKTWSKKVQSSAESQSKTGAKMKNAFDRMIHRRPRNSSSSSRTEESEIPARKLFWPLDLLATDFKDIRVMTFGYDSKPSSSTQSHLYNLSKSLLRKVADERVSCPHRPLVFVCHSLGGILAKNALTLAPNSSGAEARYKSVGTSTQGVIFFGTPHAGSSLAAWGDMLRGVSSAFKVTNSPLLNALNSESDDGQLERLRDDFSKLLGPPAEGKLRVQNYRETQPLSVAFPSFNPAADLVVPLASSHIVGEWASNLTVNGANHLSICKFTGFNDPTYESFKFTLSDFLADIASRPTTTQLGQSRQQYQREAGLESLNFRVR